ncbi:MAG: PAS domain-containing sensor histidine kinase [bacterium]
MASFKKECAAKVIDKLQADLEQLRKENKIYRQQLIKQKDFFALLGKRVFGEDYVADQAVEKLAKEICSHYENIIAAVPGHVYWYDKNNVHLGCNDEMAKAAGLSSHTEIVGKTNEELPWKASASELQKINNIVLKTGKPHIVEETGIMSSGEEKTFLTKKSPLRDSNGKITGIIGISLDITDHKRAETLEIQKRAAERAAKVEEEISNALMVFSGALSHDLRTPLASAELMLYAIENDLEVILAGYNTAKEAGLAVQKTTNRWDTGLKTTLKKILEELKTIDGYINSSLKSIRCVSKGEEAITKGDLTKCSIERVVQNTIKHYPYKNDCERKLIHTLITKNFYFLGEELLLSRVLQNLLKNAFEQIHLKGKGEIFITCETHDSENLLKIKDTAGGLDSEKINLLFGGIKSTKENGTGIGLSSSERIIKAFGGKINCKLVDKDCVEFVLSFPKTDYNPSTRI